MTSEFRQTDPQKANPHDASHYEKVSDLVLPADVRNQLAVDRLTREFLPGLRRMFPGFDAYPEPAQRALVDMAYTLGVKGLEVRFPKLVAACRSNNFSLAAAQSSRSSARAERNATTRSHFLEADRLKASVQPLAREVRP
jgi:hypothetical protein